MLSFASEVVTADMLIYIYEWIIHTYHDLQENLIYRVESNGMHASDSIYNLAQGSIPTSPIVSNKFDKRKSYFLGFFA